jgi:hypothetical protein
MRIPSWALCAFAVCAMLSGTSVGRANVRTSSGIVYITNEISDQDATGIEKHQQFLKDHVLGFEVAAALVAIMALLMMRRIKGGD